MSKLSVKKIREVESLKYLKAFRIDYTTKSGKEAVWELVSRQGIERLEAEIFDHERFTDGVMIFATNAQKTQVVMLKEFRVSVGSYVYMFPAGLSDLNETIDRAAAREFYEETGMTFEMTYVSKARYVSLGIVNECVNVAFGYYKGVPSTAHQDDKEDAEVVFVDKEEARRLLIKEDVPIRTAQLLEHFFDLNPFFSKML
jgi:ADP-ribose pyrophosphatase